MILTGGSFMEVLIVLIIILIIAIKEQIGIHKHKKETEEEVQQFRNQMKKLKDILH